MTTTYGWDASHYDWSRGPVDLSRAVKDGISFATHKACEGAHFYRDPYFARFARRAHGVVRLPGAYMVNHPGDQKAQVDWFISCLDQDAPWWRGGPFLIQLDAEKFSYMTRAPSLAECQAWCDYFVSRTGGTHRPIVYGPHWLYGDSLKGLKYPLWASDYANNPAEHYTAAYPGDGSTRWRAYSGQHPAILQFGSRLTIGAQGTCDANAFRGTIDQLIALTHSPAGQAPPSHPAPQPSDWTEGLIMALPTVKRGSTGQPVRNVQALLGAHKHATGVDGNFGPDTDAKVRAFQKEKKLAVDGIVGQHTWTALVS